MGSFPFIFVVGNVLLWAFCTSTSFHWDERIVPMWTVFAPFSIIAGIRCGIRFGVRCGIQCAPIDVIVYPSQFMLKVHVDGQRLFCVDYCLSVTIHVEGSC